jgi:hypothetical protein
VLKLYTLHIRPMLWALRGIGRASHPMIRLQVINLLSEHQHPQILAQELDHVQRIREARAVA